MAASTIPIVVSKKHIVHSEILAVTSVMRKNSRWASSSMSYAARDTALASSLGLRRSGASSNHSSRSERREAELMNGFLDLKREVRDADEIDTLPLTTLFAPFFALIRSPLSTGPITSAALWAIHNLFIAGFVTPNSPGLEAALAELSNTVSHCKFEASDASGDEVVLYRIMAVIECCMCGSVGNVLGDVEVCEMLETVLTTCCQMRLSETLRRSAESTMHSLVRHVFYRLHTLDPVEEEAKLQSGDDESQTNEITMNVQVSGDAHSTKADMIETPPEDSSKEIEVEQAAQPTPSPTSTGVKTEFGLPSILELLRVLINILDPNDRMHTDSTRLTALGVLNAAFEVASSRIGDFPSLAALILDHGCKYLFQLARSDNPTVLYLSLRVISAMFDAMRQHLKLQQELFFAFSIDRLAPAVSPKALQPKKGPTGSPRPGTPVPPSPKIPSPNVNGDTESENVGPTRPTVLPARGETRELMLETLNHMARHPSFMVDLYVNYDCDVNCEDLFEKLIDFLAKGVYPMHHADRDGQQPASQLLCLDLLLEFIKHMAGRVQGQSELWPQDHPSPEYLLQSKSRKRLVLTGASRFNSKPKVGLSFLEENGLIYSDLSDDISRPMSLAKFLKSSTRLDKRLLGDFISRPENLDVLKAFISLFDFHDKPVAEAMRELLEAFRLPGEAQQISRITETFAQCYFASKPADIKSEDAVYVLAYSIIMLNTDLHNPQNRKRMTLDDYQRNLRGVNDSSDFPPEFLKAIYDSIRKREIVMPEEHTGQVGFEYAWKELLARSRISGPFVSCNSDSFDLTMFKSVWKTVISAIAFAFTTFDDDYTVQRAIAGFRQCATLAGHFRLPEVFDYVVVSLSQVTGLLPDTLISRVPNYPIVEVEGQDVTVSTLSIKFGTNFKGQLAAVVLFTIVNGNGNAVREGWTQIFEIFQNLFLHSLLPTRMLQMEGFLGGVSLIPLQSNQPPRTTPRNEGGLLSALSSYLMTPYGSSADSLVPEATDAEVEKTLCTVDCITACRLDQLYGQIPQLEVDALVAAVRALEALAHERTVSRLKQESDDVSSTVNTPTSQHLPTLPYDPATIYLLETMISIALQTPDHIDDVWPVMFEHLSALLTSAQQFSVLLIERAVVALLRLCLILAEKPSIRDQLYVSLDLLGSLPPAVVASVGEHVIAGLALVVKRHKEIIRSQTEWGVVFAVMRNNMLHPEAARQVFELLLSLASDGPEQCVKPDNFAGLVSLLDDYATAADTAVQNHGQNMRKNNAQSPQEFVVERGRKAIDVIFDLKKFIPLFLTSGAISETQAWKQLSLPLIMAFGRQSTNACREVRQNALIQLQRTLLGPHLVPDDHTQVDYLFNRVIFPLLDELLKPQVFRLDPLGMPETRLRASTLLCKTFMHFEVKEVRKQADVRVTWIQILDLLDRLMNVDKRDQLYEAIPESLKNVVLVMNASGMLVPPSAADHRTEEQRALWDATHERLERFLPGFLEDVIPSPQPEAAHEPDTAVAQPPASPAPS